MDPTAWIRSADRPISAVDHGSVAHPTALVACQRWSPNPVRPPSTRLLHRASRPTIPSHHHLQKNRSMGDVKTRSSRINEFNH
ncbi:hypothetical protein V6N13_118114 [Hibiscus sabdariffa]